MNILTAVSRWDVENNVINLSLGDNINYNQVKKALFFWLEDLVVPGTGGKRIDFDHIKEIVAYWQLGKPVSEPLE